MPTIDLEERKFGDAIVESFEEAEKGFSDPGWLAAIRKSAISKFAERGLPTTRDEDWRFTNVTPIAQMPFTVAGRNGQAARIEREELKQFAWAGLQAQRLVFVDGDFAPELSQTGGGPGGLEIGSLAEALRTGKRHLESHLSRYSHGANNSFTTLNTAFFRDGALIHAGPGVVVEHPIHLIFLTTSDAAGAAVHPRNLIVAEKGSRLTVLETYGSLSGQRYLTNAVTEIAAEESSAIEHAKFQDESTDSFHMASLHARLGRNCQFTSHSFAAGGRISRQNLFLHLDAPGVECVLNGIYLGKDEQLVDHFMVVEHAQPHCNSHEYFNGILDDRSRGVFHGRILVRPDAQKTDAKQTNKNLLLSDNATADAKPQLEIYADDVKCTHGATVGQLSSESIFYLRARGIGEQTARRMLIHAFASEIIDRLHHPEAREELDRIFWERLEQNPTLAGDCS